MTIRPKQQPGRLDVPGVPSQVEELVHAAKHAQRPQLAVILASDSRKVAATPHALVRVAGLTLAQRTIRTIKLADIRRFVVISVAGSESVRMHFDQVGRSEDVRLEFLLAESSHQGDGSCLLTAREQIGDQPFLLVGLGCIFDPRIVRGLLDEMGPRSVTVAYEAVQPEVTVLGLVTDQGQSLPITEQIVAPKLPGIGMLACCPSFFDYLAAKPKGPPADLPNSQGSNRTSLDDAIARTAEQDDLDRFDIASIDPYIPSMRKETIPFVLRIEEPEEVGAAERTLVANACKGRNDLLATYINKPIENFIVQRFARTALTPNQVFGTLQN